MRWRDRFRRATWFAVLGLVTGAALSFAGPLVIRWDEMTLQQSREDSMAHRNRSAFWSQTALVTFLGTTPSTDDGLDKRRRDANRLTFSNGVHVLVTPEPGPVRTWQFFESGWPCTAFWGWAMTESGLPDARDEAGGIVEVPMLRSLSWQIGRIDLPYWPVWSGLAANTTLFALAWWGVIAGPGVLRRGWRRRRGRCPSCGYDLRGLPREHGATCPECGKSSI